MTDVYLSRADWGVNTSLPRLGFPVDPDRRTELHVHHTAAVDTSDFTKNRWTKTNAIRYQRKLQTVRPDLGKDIPYTEVFYVLENLDVAIMEGRGLYRTGAHTHGHNTAGIGWSVAGDFNLNDPEAITAVIKSMSNRLRYLKVTSGRFQNLGTSTPQGRVAFGHRDTKATSCPGDHLYAELDRITFGAPAPPAGTPVMGASKATVSQALAFVASKNPGYTPAIVENIVRETFRISSDEGVRADLALGLMVKETGFFRYGGDVKAEQWNFGGIDATGGVPGVTFPSVQAGVHAVVRRMRMYAAGTDGLHNVAILGKALDPKHWGAHPHIEDFNGVWAVPGDGYGQSIVALAELMAQQTIPPPPVPFTDAQTAWLDNRYVRRNT